MADEGAVTVCVRLRPLLARESALGDEAAPHWRSEGNTVSEVSGARAFSYDRVFHSSDNTQQLYEGVAVPIIQSAVQGYNGTIFAYGQTSSGKTYTMMGNKESVGVIPKAVQHVFKLICEIPDREFLLRVSYMEIYNETITDLLCDIRKKKPLGIREDVNRNTFVEDLTEEVVVSPQEVMEWIRKGEKSRHYGETKMNEHSSRSHTIFRMIIESRERSDLANANCDGAVMVSHLNLVDLAGSERASQTGSEGVRLKEGCNINRSLFILGQVIKKLCDDPSGFINYRDSKLTRILQNSLGGNAKTVIICTITPVSFDETLSTLQFANTAKGMKNTPKVNEVLNDDALLKRYRKEILDLKKQLEEVSLKTQLHAVEKDQLAQLLEEKNSLQKVQEDRIRNLTEMLVTSASFSAKQDIKAKKRRRVTWAPGKINQKNVNYFEDFEKTELTETKKMKASLSFLPDGEGSTFSESSENDNQCLTLPDQISDTEWTPGPHMNWTLKFFEESTQRCDVSTLEKDLALSEVNVLQDNFNKLVLENEQLKLEINEMKEKLKEKMEIEEFETLEKQTQKEHETELMHEVTSLKNVVSNVEAHNVELEAEISSKLEQLKEKENKIKTLQNRVEELQKAGVEKKDASVSARDFGKLLEEVQQLTKSLLDSEAIALDAKKESSFLRTENLELKEKMNELSSNYKQMQKDVQLYQSQIEAGKASYKKMEADLQKELQSVFQENTRLTALMEGKVPKDLLSVVELEKKASDIKAELEKASEENALLQKQVNELPEFQSLPSSVEMQQRELLEKCEELRLLELDREKLLSEAADNEVKLKCMTEEIGKLKEDLADAQLKYENCDEEYVALKQLHEELELKYVAASENSEQMKLQIEHLSKEAEESETALDDVKSELSNKMKELEKKTAEHEHLLGVREDLIQTQQKLNEMEQLKEQEKIMESRLEAKDSELQAVLQELRGCREEIKALTQERDDLKQREESLQAEKDQLSEDIKDTVSMNILAHDELRNAQSSLKQSQETVKKLEKSLSEKESQMLSVEETLRKTISDLERQLAEVTENLTRVSSEYDTLLAEKEQAERIMNEHVCQEPEKIAVLNQEKEELQQMVEVSKAERDQLEANCQESKKRLSEVLTEMESLQEELKHHKEQSDIQKNLIAEGEEKQQKTEEELTEEIKKLKEKINALSEDLSLVTKERQQLLGELKEKTESENKDDELQQLEKRCAVLAWERDEFEEMLEAVRAEKNKLEVNLQKSVDKLLETEKELKRQQELLSNEKIKAEEREEHLLKVQRRSEIVQDSLTSKIQQLTETLDSVSSEKDQLLAERTSHSSQLKEQISSVSEEKDELQKLLQDTRSERDQLNVELQKSSEMYIETSAKLECALSKLKERSLSDASVQVDALDNAEQTDDDSLKAKTMRIKELLELFPSVEKRYECLSTMSCRKKEDLNSQKAVIAAILTQLSPEQNKQVKRLQMENEKINTHFQRLLDRLKFQFHLLCSKKMEYHATVNKYAMELLEEKRKQDQLQAQIRGLKEFHLTQKEIPARVVNVGEVLQSLHSDAENIIKDVSEMESELLSIEAELQKEERAGKETARFWEACSGLHCDAEELKEALRKDNERLLQVIKFWTAKAKTFSPLNSELNDRTSNYCKNADAEYKRTKEKTEELLQELNALKEQLAPGGSAHLLLEEENNRLHNRLKAAEQDKKAMEVKIQKLENIAKEAEKNVREKDDRIDQLQAQMKVKAATSELTQLEAKLNETEKSLSTVLAENQSLQEKLNKGAELYKEEINDLKTQLVRYDMDRTKQSKIFDMQLANYKAVAEHQEEQLRKLKEELRRAQQDQDVTVVSTETPQQYQKPLTCVCSELYHCHHHVLVLKSEQVKLQEENLQMKKQIDDLLSNEAQLKDEIRKWKERALKLKEKSSRETTRETVPRSPAKKVPDSLKEQNPSFKEPISQETVTQDASKPLPLTCPTNFFDNSNLGMLTDVPPAGTEPTEQPFSQWLGASEKDKAPDCTTQ
ncbi:centromere-associated protein E-like [Aythya fuligula]|uniref:Centromere-associated protein E n=1 Tax=Aythya fuligula TaxID=219594 RepID=A0A6J3CWM3_AYTFU|nr:centromere-associated protein E-like [Aythya fuligula]